MRRIILVRHGETEENLKGILQGHRYGTLTERGRAQVGLLAERLKAEPLEAIFSSDLERARDTTAALVAYHSCPVYYLEGLRERSLGEFEGHPVSMLSDAIEATGADPLAFEAPGGESVEKVAARAVRSFETILREHDYRYFAVVAHGLFNRALLTRLAGRPLPELFELEQENACVNLIEYDGSTFSLELVNCLTHLSDEHVSRRGRTHY